MPPPNTSASSAPAEETTETFTARFYSLLDTLTSTSPQAKSETDLSSLRSTLSQARDLFSYGPQWWVGYEIRKAQEALLQAENAIDTATHRIYPRQRFRFRDRGHAKRKDKKKEVEAVKETVVLNTGGCVEVDEGMVKDGVVELSELDGKDVSVRGLHDARVVIRDVVGAVRMVDVERCEIVAVKVAGSVHVTRAKGCVFWVACRQVRVHESEGCVLWLDVAGGVIIEGCRQMRFGPVEFRGEIGGEEKGKGWDEVRDFEWLRKEQSPNWEVVEEGEWGRGVVKVLKEEGVEIGGGVEK